jgi:peptide/nickel transport system substrate-binding protein
MHNTTDGAIESMLAESWSVSSDFTTWTFKIRKGVEFHKGYGEMTSEDVVWSHKMGAESERHPRATLIGNMWFNENGSLETPDDYTVVLNTGAAFSDIVMLEPITNPRCCNVWIASKKQHEEAGEEEATRNTATTGPWEIQDWRTGEFWKLAAVEDHWRKTPFFAEMTIWEVPEESARVAGFQTGNLDTFAMSMDAIPLVEAMEGAKLMQVPDSGQGSIHFYGQAYTDGERGGYHPDLPWVSTDPDITSDEWAKARNVRLALSIAIDRQLLVDTLLAGFGHPMAVWNWGGPAEARLESDMVWDFDPDRSRELLADAGYPDGFSITLTPSIRNAPAEVEVCEAIMQMWEDIGLDVTFQRIPYSALRPTLVGRTYEGATCHALFIRLAPVEALANYQAKSVFHYGVDHPWLEEKIPLVQTSVAKAEREVLELEVARFTFDNVLAQVGLFTFDNIWAVGPKLEPWDDFVRKGDLRQMNGLEWVQPRK